MLDIKDNIKFLNHICVINCFSSKLSTRVWFISSWKRWENLLFNISRLDILPFLFFFEVCYNLTNTVALKTIFIHLKNSFLKGGIVSIISSDYPYIEGLAWFTKGPLNPNRSMMAENFPSSTNWLFLLRKTFKVRVG